jgi:hypothetical protein
MYGDRATERKVWLLPVELSDRLKAFQESQGIGSEVEAARRLLDYALQMRDTMPDILQRLADRYRGEQNLRALARDILVGHALVSSVSFEDRCVRFQLSNGAVGRIDDRGEVSSDVNPTRDDAPACCARSGVCATCGEVWDRPNSVIGHDGCTLTVGDLRRQRERAAVGEEDMSGG